MDQQELSVIGQFRKFKLRNDAESQDEYVGATKA